MGFGAGLDGCGKKRPPTGIPSPDEIDVGEDIINEYNIMHLLLYTNLITVQQAATYSVYYISVGSSKCFGC